jgi:IS5 family transposase
MARPDHWPISLTKDLTPPSRGRADVFLHEVDALVDWSEVDQILSALPVNPATRPRYPGRLLLKIMLLQSWYGLSDPAAEGAVNDRQSFARFVELPQGAPSPSYSTINRFRAELTRRGLVARLFSAVTNQLADKGYAVREGAMVEASLLDIGQPH